MSIHYINLMAFDSVLIQIAYCFFVLYRITHNDYLFGSRSAFFNNSGCYFFLYFITVPIFILLTNR